MKKARPPIVTVLGHVDHGKTTLLDSLRKTKVQAREAGGITQGIGASSLETSEGIITFIDTPGHAAFSKMREQGSRLADIVLLIIAADDGLKPQTEEVIGYLKDTKTPFIVVFNKTDLASADVDRVKSQLMEREILLEGYGGDVPSVEVSAKDNKGMDDLLEMIYLVAEVNEVSGDPEGTLLGSVVESNKDKRGVVVSIVVKNGVLQVGQEIEASGLKAKIKGIFDENNKPIKQVLPGFAGAVLGFSELPVVGSPVTVLGGSEAVDGENGVFVNRKVEVSEKQIGIVLKASSAGKLEAVKNSLPSDAVVLSSGVGDVNDSDIFLAKSGDGVVVSFEAKASSAIKKLADTEGVTIRVFQVIYELIDYVSELIEQKKEKYGGKAQIQAIFPFNNKRVAGCKILEGVIKEGDRLTIRRGERDIGTSKAVSIKRGKEDINEAKAGEECGILLAPQLDFMEGDMLLSVKP